jgi:hypothetical protein
VNRTRIWRTIFSRRRQIRSPKNKILEKQTNSPSAHTHTIYFVTYSYHLLHDIRHTIYLAWVFDKAGFFRVRNCISTHPPWPPFWHTTHLQQQQQQQHNSVSFFVAVNLILSFSWKNRVTRLDSSCFCFWVSLGLIKILNSRGHWII